MYIQMPLQALSMVSIPFLTGYGHCLWLYCYPLPFSKRWKAYSSSGWCRQAKSGSLRDIQPANAYHTIRSYPKSQAYSCHSEHSVYLQTESATRWFRQKYRHYPTNVCSGLYRWSKYLARYYNQGTDDKPAYQYHHSMTHYVLAENRNHQAYWHTGLSHSDNNSILFPGLHIPRLR